MDSKGRGRDCNRRDDALASLQAGTSVSKKTKRHAEQSAGEQVMKALMRLYRWRVQVGGAKKGARLAATRDRCASRASTIHALGGDGGIDGGEG